RPRRHAVQRRLLAGPPGLGSRHADGPPARPRRGAHGRRRVDLALRTAARGPAPAAAPRPGLPGAAMSTIDDIPAAGHERRDVSVATVVKWGAGVLGLVVFTVAVMWLMLLRLQAREEHESAPASPLASYGPQEPPQPRLQ